MNSHLRTNNTKIKQISRLIKSFKLTFICYFYVKFLENKRYANIRSVAMEVAQIELSRDPDSLRLHGLARARTQEFWVQNY